jgi:hypothetical protein
MKLVDTATLGHVGTEYLSASALSDIYTTSTGFVLRGGVLSTFVGQAYGAKNYRLAGIWFQVGTAVGLAGVGREGECVSWCRRQLSMVVIFLLAVPVILSWNLTSYVLDAFGEHGAINERATYYSQVLSMSIPGQIIFSQVGRMEGGGRMLVLGPVILFLSPPCRATLLSPQASSYFQAQSIVAPGVVSTVVAFFVNLLLCLFVVLGVGIPNFGGLGFYACPVVTLAAVYVQACLIVFVYFGCLGLHKPTWPGFQWSEITRARLKAFLTLYLPAM